MNRIKRVMLVFLVLFLLYLGFQYVQAYVYYLDLQEDLSVANNQYHALEMENLQLQESLAHVGSLSYIEKIAREELSLVKDGETLLILIKDK